jgi:hypothetical protein
VGDIPVSRSSDEPNDLVGVSDRVKPISGNNRANSFVRIFLLSKINLRGPDLGRISRLWIFIVCHFFDNESLHGRKNGKNKVHLAQMALRGVGVSF